MRFSVLLGSLLVVSSSGFAEEPKRDPAGNIITEALKVQERDAKRLDDALKAMNNERPPKPATEKPAKTNPEKPAKSNPEKSTPDKPTKGKGT